MGNDLWDACHRMETLERVAKVVLVGRLLGRTEPLPERALALLAGALNGSL
jgi:L-fuculose-phosphate aldolase